MKDRQMTIQANPKSEPMALYQYSCIADLGLCPLVQGDAPGVPQKVQISIARSYRSKQWETITLQFSEFLERTMKHSIGSKEGSAWSPFVFEDGRRSSQTSRSTQLLVYDCDSGCLAPCVWATDQGFL